jgi:hypothetical protein
MKILLTGFEAFGGYETISKIAINTIVNNLN